MRRFPAQFPRRAALVVDGISVHIAPGAPCNLLKRVRFLSLTEELKCYIRLLILDAESNYKADMYYLNPKRKRDQKSDL